MPKFRYGDFEVDIPDDLVVQARDSLVSLSQAGTAYLNASTPKTSCSPINEYSKTITNGYIEKIADVWISLCRFQHESNEHAIMEASGRVAVSILGFGLPALMYGPQAEKEASAYMRKFETLIDKLCNTSELLTHYRLTRDPEIRIRLDEGENEDCLCQEIDLWASRAAKQIVGQKTRLFSKRSPLNCLPLAKNTSTDDYWVDILEFTALTWHCSDVVSLHKKFIRKIRGLS